MKRLVDLYVKQIKHNEKLVYVPILLIIFSILALGYNYISVGEIVSKGVTLNGGTTITIEGDVPANLVSDLEQTFPRHQFSQRLLTDINQPIGVIIQTTLIEEQDELRGAIFSQVDRSQVSFQTIGPSIGAQFFAQMQRAVIIALIFMALVVYVAFRSKIPSLAIIVAILADLLVTLAVFDLTGQRLSSAGVAAFLMIIGYSVDTNILLSSRVLKRGDVSFYHRLEGAFKTGLMMSGTTLCALLAALFFTNSEIIFQIMLILFIGLLADALNTWITNALLLKYYVKKKGDLQ